MRVGGQRGLTGAQARRQTTYELSGWMVNKALDGVPQWNCLSAAGGCGKTGANQKVEVREEPEA